MPRTLWKGAISFKRYNKETGEEVPWNQIVKGYEYEKER